jgi:hypothetical protein
LVKVFAGSAPTAVVAAYSVGQQIAIAAFTALVGLGAVVLIFRFRSFKEVIAAGRASREAERQSERAASACGRGGLERGGAPAERGEPTEAPRAPRARA